MKHWVRYQYKNQVGFGTLDAEKIQIYSGSMFDSPQRTEHSLLLEQVNLLTPTQASKMIALWNNFKALADAKELSYPKDILYIIKPPNSYLSQGETIRHPSSYSGKIFFEGELGIIIGKQASNLETNDQADAAIFGYTCINDVTAFDLLKDDKNFDQWTRSKGFDTFGAFGPVVTEDLNYQQLEIITRVNGEEVQHYRADDMIFSPAEIVTQLSCNMTLYPGDVICCGTSLGLGPMPKNCNVEIQINNIGVLMNRYE